jgi:hypothetical protein
MRCSVGRVRRFYCRDHFGEQARDPEQSSHATAPQRGRRHSHPSAQVDDQEERGVAPHTGVQPTVLVHTSHDLPHDERALRLQGRPWLVRPRFGWVATEQHTAPAPARRRAKAKEGTLPCKRTGEAALEGRSTEVEQGRVVVPRVNTVSTQLLARGAVETHTALALLKPQRIETPADLLVKQP